MNSISDPRPARASAVDDRLLKSAVSHARVMMIDDEPILIELVHAFLEDAGYQDLVGISDPQSALKSLIEKKPDVLLLDLMMPEVNGFDILEQVRSNDELRHIPVIVMTSASDAETKLRVLELGATDFLEKPVDPSELVLRLRNTLAFKAHRDRTTYFDALTNLPNRRLFMSQLASTLKRMQKANNDCAIIHIDFDRLRQVRQTLGNRIGDAMVRNIANRIQARLAAVVPMAGNTEPQSPWSLSRIADTEFVVLLPAPINSLKTAEVARSILAIMGRPVIVDEHEVMVSASIGIAISPGDGSDEEILLQHANTALFAAKEQGKNSYCFYSDDLNAEAINRLKTEIELRKAIVKDELEIYYQPKVDVASNRIVGAEALIRWNHPSRGLVSPAEFIPLAEEIGLIADIGNWVLHGACKEAVRWRDEGITDCGIAVNVSPQHFQDGRLLRDVEHAIMESGLNPCMLTIEITESMMMHHSEENLLGLAALNTMGIKTSLDDFGTGYSSLTYLSRMRLDELKIDKSFVSGLPGKTDSAGIVRAVLAMSHSLGLNVTAEGVETEEQLEFLRQHDLQIHQGFLCSQPIPADRFLHLLHQEFTDASMLVKEPDRVLSS